MFMRTAAFGVDVDRTGSRIGKAERLIAILPQNKGQNFATGFIIVDDDGSRLHGYLLGSNGEMPLW
jgi:hypothetical protein